MRYTKIAAVAAMAAVGEAQRPNGTSICDYYTTALLKNNTAENQMTLLTLVVNTAVIGNYTTPNVGIAVTGILNNGTGNYTGVNLLPYFDGGLASSNRGGSSGVAVNFLDGGGAAPLMKNMPADDTTSNQYFLLTHLYQYFGTALGCSMQGMNSTYKSYQGVASQYSVHKFMDLNHQQVSYFIQQVGLSAASFGVASADVEAVGMELNQYFNYRCAAAMTLIPPSAGPQLQAICIDSDCPEAQNATCASYAAAVQPGVANSTLAMGEGNSSSTATSSAAGGGSMSMSATSSATSAPATGAAAKNLVGGVAAGALGVAAFFL